MSGVELVLAFLAGVVMGGALDRFVLPHLAPDQIGAILAVTAVVLRLITRSRVSPA
jgi:multisubunit Na+/H+ antiporter MnhE subunit